MVSTVGLGKMPSTFVVKLVLKVSKLRVKKNKLIFRFITPDLQKEGVGKISKNPLENLTN